MLLPIEVARLCPDCDVLTEAATCPQCGRARTFPLTEWVGRLDLAPAGNNQTLVPRLAGPPRNGAGATRARSPAGARFAPGSKPLPRSGDRHRDGHAGRLATSDPGHALSRHVQLDPVVAPAPSGPSAG